MSKVTTPTIIHVASYYPPHLGGMENCVAQIAGRLANRGYAVQVYTSDIGCSQSMVSDSNSKQLVHYLKSIEFAHTPIMFTLFFRLLSLPRHSLIHLHIAQAFSAEIVYLISKMRRIPYVAHIHLDVDPSGPMGFFLESYKKLFLKKVLKSAAKIICLSEAQKKIIALKYALSEESIVVVPNGVAEAYFVGEKTSRHLTPHLLFVGRLVAQKNLSLLIEAVAQMQTPVFVDIVGEGELRKDIEALIQKHLLQNVQLHGKKTGEELIQLYRSAELFMLPSKKEGVSLAMLEALAAGLPVVASDLPEIRPILQECGVLVQDPTPANYAKAVDALLADKDALERLSTLSVQRARSYSWENVLEAVEGVYYKEVNNDIR